MKTLRYWWYLNKESFLMLRRDRVFTPMLVIGVAIALFASLASGWTIEDDEKILFDIGIAGFRITGAVVAMLWGVRMMTDPLQDRSIELRIAAPSARYAWIISRYTGLAICLLLMGCTFALIWQAVMYFNHLGTMTNMHGWILFMLVAEWFALGAIGLLMGTLAGFSTAIFATFSAWIAGLIAPLVAATMDPNTDPTQKRIVLWIADTWNFQRFNLLDQLERGARTADYNDLIARLSWGGSLLLGCLVLASWIFQDKDLT